MYDYERIDAAGFEGEPVPHTLIRRKGGAEHGVVILPGLGYTAHMPLLYYATAIALEAGADVLRLEYEYVKRPEFMERSGEGRKAWLLADVAGACGAFWQTRAYGRVTLIGKSLGTRAMGHLLTTDPYCSAAAAIWLTPILTSEALRAEIRQASPRSLFVIGTQDPFYDEGHLQAVLGATGGEVILVDGADHGLEIAGDLEASLGALSRAVLAMRSFMAVG